MKVEYTNFEVLEKEVSWTNEVRVKAVAYTEIKTGVWPWSQPKVRKVRAYRGRFDAFFVTADGEALPSQIQCLVQLAEARTESQA